MEHSGTKYHRRIKDIYGRECFVFNSEKEEFELATIDVYCVIDAFEIARPAMQHASKKVLCTGIRGKGDERQDIQEAIDALTRRLQEIK